MTQVGIAISGGPTPSEIIDLIWLAESLGYESAWVAEGHGGDQFSILSGSAMRTSTIHLGTAISSVYVRSIPTIAMADLSGLSSEEGQVDPILVLAGIASAVD